MITFSVSMRNNSTPRVRTLSRRALRFPGLPGFGRRNMIVKPADLKNYLAYQVGALQVFATGHAQSLMRSQLYSE